MPVQVSEAASVSAQNCGSQGQPTLRPARNDRQSDDGRESEQMLDIEFVHLICT